MTDEILKILLRDQTTLRNILWANELRETDEIQLAEIDSIRPRHEKNRTEQKLRTRARAEIFTPPEACRLQNDAIDAAWLKSFVAPWLKENFKLDESSPTDRELLDANLKKISAAWFYRVGISREKPAEIDDTFVANWLGANETLWQNYVDAKFLEITCGEAPYITARYNAATGTPIDFPDRYGLLDRKLRVVDNCAPAADRLAWTIRAVQSVYGYEFQGDNLFLARKNIFLTVEEFLSGKVSAAELEKILPQVAEIISWNFWQMDGLECTIPFADTNPNQSLFDEPPPPREIFCKILDWRTREPITFKELVGKTRR